MIIIEFCWRPEETSLIKNESGGQLGLHFWPFSPVILLSKYLSMSSPVISKLFGCKSKKVKIGEIGGDTQYLCKTKYDDE